MKQGKCVKDVKEDGSSTPRKAIAFVGLKQYDDVEEDDYTCEFGTKRAEFTAVENDGDDKEDRAYKGFSLYFDANVDHASIDTWESFTINAVCAEKAKWEEPRWEGYNLIYEYEGPEACKFVEIDLTGAANFIEKFMGLICIVVGALLAFVGSKFIIYVFGTLVFTLFTIVLFGIGYSLHLINVEHPNKSVGALVGFSVLSVLGGGALAYYSGRFVDMWAIPLIAGFCGGLVPFMLLGPLHLKSYVRLPIVFICAGVAVYLSKVLNKFIKSAGTAIIGSFFLMYGVGRYAGGFPDIASADTDSSESKIKVSLGHGSDAKKAVGYIVGMVVCSVLGTFIQLKYIASDDDQKDADDFMNKTDS